MVRSLDWLACGDVSREKYQHPKYGFTDYQIITPIMVILTELKIHKVRHLT